ncbi:hypothetical protein [Spiroplasma monobiae]|uniref:Uncharacterized protein n=1 Tax=Spiroplasma monobiae MQ-1 TaxID=1336748 RepID=A0A2K9LU81_SPISQ|nr:hypothetical protein [Spiroplasma monobiae]AUM62461.1 hypothetical protein SMONO_v1c02100 [Spiroplasma monobiae MQ-1]
MEKLNLNQKREIVGGKGITGALLSGIGSIAKGAADFLTNTVGAISTTVFTAMSLNKVDKLESKIGNSTFKTDNTTSNKINLEADYKTPNVVSLF